MPLSNLTASTLLHAFNATPVEVSSAGYYAVRDAVTYRRPISLTIIVNHNLDSSIKLGKQVIDNSGFFVQILNGCGSTAVPTRNLRMFQWSTNDGSKIAN